MDEITASPQRRMCGDTVLGDGTVVNRWLYNNKLESKMKKSVC